MKIVVRLEPATESPPDVSYRWDADTDILSAQLSANGTGDGMSGSVGLEGTDGSWLILDVADGRINGVEVAVWPDVRNIAGFALPSNVENARVVVPSRTSQPSIASLEMAVAILVEAALSFLGLGVPEPYPSWGRMLSVSAAEYAQKAPHLVLYPGLAISLAVFGSNLFGDALRDTLDPRLRGA